MALPQRIAAIPQYARHDLKEAAPGHRFQLYLEHWQGQGGNSFEPYKKSRPQGSEERNTHTRETANVLKDLCPLPASSVAALQGIRTRQQALLAHYGSNGYSISSLSTAPFATGLGNEHPIENGFAFLTPYGLPYLAGSGVKGILRRSMQELLRDGEAGFTDEAINALFGPETIDKPEDAQRGALDFWDVFPSPAGNKLTVEIMTPHYGGYYQRGESPHDSGAPVPVSFLAVPANSQFDFAVVCHATRLPAPLQDPWRSLLDRAFQHAFEWVGFGAKTSVGYGAMAEDQNTKKRKETARQKGLDDVRVAQERQEKEAAKSKMPPALRAAQDFLDQRADKNQPELSALIGALKKGIWSGDIQLEIAQHTKTQMVAAKKWKEASEKKNPAKDNDHQDTLAVRQWLTVQK